MLVCYNDNKYSSDDHTMHTIIRAVYSQYNIILSYEYMASDSNQVLFGCIYMYMHNNHIDSHTVLERMFYKEKWYTARKTCMHKQVHTVYYTDSHAIIIIAIQNEFK